LYSPALASTLRWLTARWERLVEPAVSVEQPDHRRQSRLMAAFVAALALITLLVLALHVLVSRPVISGSLFVSNLVFFVCLLIPYRLARRGHYQAAAWLVIVAASILIFAAASSGEFVALNTLHSLLLVVLIASAFLPPRAMLALLTAHALGMLILAAYVAPSFASYILYSPFIIVVGGGVLIWLITHHRQTLEDDRRAQLALELAERKLAEAALRRSEERYRILSELMSDYAYVYRVEPDGSFEHEWITDEAFTRVTGYTYQEVDALPPFALFHPDEHPALPEQQERLRRGEPVSGDYRIITKGGETRWVHISRQPVWDEQEGRVVRLLCRAKDITERRLAEEQKLNLVLERERLLLVSRFVSAVSHDFRTALANIETSRYLAQRLLSTAEREKVQHRLDTIRHAVAHLTEQLGNLHTISFLGEPNPEICNLNALVESLIVGQTARAQEKNITLSFSPDQALPLVRVDKEELRRAIRHLLVNALAHTPEGGTVTVRTAHTLKEALVEVADTGAGIDGEHLAYIFDPFYRGDSARSIDSGGIGLGLSIVKMVAEAHGGSVAVKSAPGKGSVFTVALPIAPVVAERS
jgi:PAS domain S-box-containing protein